jgi:hypothetical protein
MFEINGSISTNDGVSFTFGAGGNQGGEGNDGGAEWFIENVREELDAANEYFFDRDKSQLLFVYNGTGAPPSSLKFEVPQLRNLIELHGSSSDSPITNVAIHDLTFKDTRPTFMDPRSNPSGGDWALERNGAFLLENTENITISDSLFTHLDSNAISVNGYNRYLSVTDNEAVWLGQNFIASWGRPDGNSGLNGIFPRYTSVTGNFVHEIGHIQKQSSFYFQAETAQTHIANNIVFNIPRAAINFNDGFGGGSEIVDNLLFNTCRESGDHGAFNSWDRLPYVTDIRNPGVPSTIPAHNEAHRNFIVSNYAADGGCLDNDDGSSYYDIHHNFCVYGGHKGDFDGNNKRSFNNIAVYPSVYGVTCVSIGAQGLPPLGYADGYYNNTCILSNNGANYLRVPGDLKDTKAFKAGMIVHDNKVYAPKANVTVSLNGKVYSFEEFVSKGLDPGTTVKDGDTLNVETIIEWGRDVLQMQ